MNRTSPIGGRARAATLLLGFALALGLLPFAPHPASAAAPFVVTRPDDQPDLTPADGVCDVDLAAGDQCTLRAAIQQANKTAGADVIHFAIPGPGVHTITPASALPEVTRPVTIDGYTQPGAHPNTLAAGTDAALRVQLDGRNAGNPSGGLVVRGPNSVVKGLAINRFARHGVVIDETARGSRLEGCFVGTDAAGAADLGNGNIGVAVLAPDAVVGGATPAARNILSGNGEAGVAVIEAATGVRIHGNLIGTDKSGAGPLGNGTGVLLANPEGSAINAEGSTIGGNTVAFNLGDGIRVAIGPGNRIGRNSVFANGDLGIDLEPDGFNTNDPLDTDGGANRRQNTPLLDKATTAGSATTIRGRLNSTPSATFVLRFYANPSGNEGKRFLGLTSVTTKDDGNKAFAFTPAQAIPVGQTVTATATNTATGDTSEFSRPATVA